MNTLLTLYKILAMFILRIFSLHFSVSYLGTVLSDSTVLSHNTALFQDMITRSNFLKRVRVPLNTYTYNRTLKVCFLLK